MFLTKYSRCVLEPKLFFPSVSFTTSKVFKEVSSKPLQQSNAISEANFTKKSHSINTADEAYRNEQDKKNPEDVNLCSSPSEEKLQVKKPEHLESVKTVKPSDLGLVQRTESTEILLSADPFEEVPGPVLLKKISNIWKYLPEIGCQATVSAMLSFFNVKQKLSVESILGKSDSRPFDSLFRKYGPIVKLQGPLGSDVVLICKPEHVAKVYNQEGKYPIRSTLDSVEKCRSRSRKSCGGPFNLKGIEWEEMRKALQTPLYTGGEKYFHAIHEAGDMFVKRIRSIKNRQSEVPGDFMAEITKWSLECICFVILGKSLAFHTMDRTNSDSIKLLKAVNEATKHFCECESGFQFWRFVNTSHMVGLTQACEVIDGYMSKHIRLAQVNLTRNKDEILSQDKQEASLPFIENLLLNECMAPDEVLTCILDLLLIGVNTTSSSLAFTMYYLAQNQRTQRVLFKEIKNVLPQKDSELQYNQLSSMKYLESCLNETLRLRLPIPVLSRVIPDDIVLSNFRIPKRTYIVMDVQAACLKEQNFEKCDKFFPERWFDSSNIQPFSFIPFGHGSRSCLGKHLAEAQLKSCIAKVIRNFQVEYNYGEIRGTKTVISFPDKPLKLSFIEREE